MRKLMTLAAMAVAALAMLALGQGQPSTANTDLVVNGDFETPIVMATAGWDIFPDGATGLGWTVEWVASAGACAAGTPGASNPQLELHRGVNGWLPKDGSQHAELDTDCHGPAGGPGPEYTNVRIYQDIPTCAGGSYDINYSWSPRPGHNNNGLTVKWDGAPIATHSGAGGSNTSWTVETHSKTASGTTTRLEFQETGAADSLGMFLDAVSVVETLCVITVDIDIKPGSDPNCINPDGNGVIPVAILTTETFDATTVDPASVYLDGAGVAVRGKSDKMLAAIEDVDGDGDLDLVVKIVDNAVLGGQTTATLTGNLFDGTPIEGTDFICIVPPADS